MFIAQVKGHVVSTVKDSSMTGHKLLIVEPMKVDPPNKLTPTNRAIVAIDTIGAGEGQLVLISQGSSARLADGLSKTPVDAVIIGLIDKAVVDGQSLL